MLGIGLKTTALRRIFSKNFGIGRFYEDSFRNGGLHLQRKINMFLLWTRVSVA